MVDDVVTNSDGDVATDVSASSSTGGGSVPRARARGALGNVGEVGGAATRGVCVCTGNRDGAGVLPSRVRGNLSSAWRTAVIVGGRRAGSFAMSWLMSSSRWGEQPVNVEARGMGAVRWASRMESRSPS